MFVCLWYRYGKSYSVSGFDLDLKCLFGGCSINNNNNPPLQILKNCRPETNVFLGVAITEIYINKHKHIYDYHITFDVHKCAGMDRPVVVFSKALVHSVMMFTD